MPSPQRTHGDAGGIGAAGVTRPAAWGPVILAGLLGLAAPALFLATAGRDLLAVNQGLDARFYQQWAADIVAGRPYDGVFFQGPLYPYLLAAMYRVAGATEAAGHALQLVLAGITAALVFAMARRLAGGAAAWAAATLQSLYGYGLVLAGLMVPALAIQACAAAALAVAVFAAGGAGRRRWLAAAVGGGCIGLAALGRGSMLLAPLPLLVLALGRRRGCNRATAGTILAAVAGCALVIAPVTLRNWRAGGEAVLISANGGYNYAVGNADGAAGTYRQEEGVAFFQPGRPHDGGTIDLARRLAGADAVAGPAAASRWWWRRGLDWNREHPGRTVGLWARKFAMLVSDYEVPQIEDFRDLKARSAWLRLNPVRFGLLVGLAVVGGWAGLRRDRSRTLLVIAGAAGVILSILPFFVAARYRLPLVPAVAVLAGVGAAEIGVALRARAWRRGGLLAAAACVVTAATLLYVPADVARAADRMRAYNAGLEAGKAGRIDEAIAHFQESVKSHPDHAPSWGNLGALMQASGRPADAVTAFARALALDAGNRGLPPLLAQAAAAAGRVPSAASSLEAAVTAAPDNDVAWLMLAETRLILGDVEGARAAANAALARARDARTADAARMTLEALEAPSGQQP